MRMEMRETMKTRTAIKRKTSTAMSIRLWLALVETTMLPIRCGGNDLQVQALILNILTVLVLVINVVPVPVPVPVRLPTMTLTTWD